MEQNKTYFCCFCQSIELLPWLTVGSKEMAEDSQLLSFVQQGSTLAQLAFEVL